MPLASDMRERIELERLIEAADGVTKTWTALDNSPLWAAVEPQGQATYRFRIRYRDDLLHQGSIEPAMRVVYRGEVLDLTDVIEAVRRQETHLIASRRIVEDIDHLATGTRRIQTWPASQ